MFSQRLVTPAFRAAPRFAPPLRAPAPRSSLLLQLAPRPYSSFGCSRGADRPSASSQRASYATWSTPPPPLPGAASWARPAWSGQSPGKAGVLAAVKRHASTYGAYGASGQRWDYKRLAITGALVAGTVALADGFFNRDTREGALSAGERSLLNSAFAYTGCGLLATAATSLYLFRSGFVFRVMSASPWAVLGLGLVGGIGTMLGTRMTSPENKVQKHLFWLGFNACQAATLCPLFFLGPAVLGRAALYTLGMVGSLSYVGATAKTDKYLYMGGPLLAGITIVALSSLAPMVLPVTAARTLMATEAISLYGGLAVFGGFVLYDTQKILHHGRLAEQGVIKADPVNESVGLILDVINVFIRMVQIVMMQQNRKK